MRKRLAVLVFAAILVLPGISRAETEQGPPQPTQSLRTQIELTVSASDSAVRAKDPYRSLFPPAGPGSATPDRTAGQAVPAPSPNARPSVVCGLTVIPVDPNIDPGIRRVVPDTGPRFTYRPFTTKACQAK